MIACVKRRPCKSELSKKVTGILPARASRIVDLPQQEGPSTSPGWAYPVSPCRIARRPFLPSGTVTHRSFHVKNTPFGLAMEPISMCVTKFPSPFCCPTASTSSDFSKLEWITRDGDLWISEWGCGGAEWEKFSRARKHIFFGTYASHLWIAINFLRWCRWAWNECPSRHIDSVIFHGIGWRRPWCPSRHMNLRVHAGSYQSLKAREI